MSLAAIDVGGSEEQLAALIAKLKDDEGLQEKLKGASDLDAVLAIVKEAGFDVSAAAWLRYQAKQTIELSDEELEGVAGARVGGASIGYDLFGRCKTLGKLGTAENCYP